MTKKLLFLIIFVFSASLCGQDASEYAHDSIAKSKAPFSEYLHCNNTCHSLCIDMEELWQEDEPDRVVTMLNYCLKKCADNYSNELRRERMRQKYKMREQKKEEAKRSQEKTEDSQNL